MKRLLFLLLVLIPAIVSAQTLDIDVDDNTATDIAFGGTNTTDGSINATEVSLDEIQLDVTHTAAHSEGLITWNDDDKTLNIDTEVSGTSIQVGQEIVLRARNETGSTIPDGQAVYVDGATGSRPTIDLSDSDNGTATGRTIGVVTADIANNGTGYVTAFGLVRDVDTSSWTAGDLLYISDDPETDGGITNSVPDYPQHIMRIGYCIFSNADSGIIFVSSEKGDHLEHLYEVDLSGATTGQALAYNGAGQWTAQTVAGSGDLLAASNLADVASAATSFGNIKQAALDTATGVVELATSAEVVTGTDATRVVTPDTLTDKMAAPGAIGGTTPGAGTFTEVTVSPSATPTMTFEDSDDAAGTASIFGNSAGGANDIIMSIGVEDSTGENTEYMQVNGVDETVDFLKPTTLQAGDIIEADLATASVSYTKTTGSIKSLTPVTDDADNFAANFTGANLYGGTFIANAAGTAQLPAITAGMNFTIITLGAVAVVVEPNASDSFLLDGVQLDDADSATNTSTAGDIIVYQYYSAAGWVASSNGWTDED